MCAIECLWRSEDNSYHHMTLRDQTQMIRYGSKCLCLTTEPSHQVPSSLLSQMNRYQTCPADFQIRLVVLSIFQIAAIKILFLLCFLISASGPDRVPSFYPVLEFNPFPILALILEFKFSGHWIQSVGSFLNIKGMWSV